LPFLLCVALISSAQTKDETRPFDQRHPVERPIAGGESHSYQIPLTQGQCVRFQADQHAIDASIILSAPDGKQIAESNLTEVGSETLALEAPVTGIYLVSVRGNGGPTMRGAYKLETTVQASASLQDRKYLTAQTLLLDAQELAKQFPKTAPQARRLVSETRHFRNLVRPLLRAIQEREVVPCWTSRRTAASRREKRIPRLCRCNTLAI
jgi:hypothetical protein